jgi:hypothetical protein
MTFGNTIDIEAALLRLGKKLMYDYAEPISLVVCGGSALNVLNIAKLMDSQQCKASSEGTGL